MDAVQKRGILLWQFRTGDFVSKVHVEVQTIEEESELVAKFQPAERSNERFAITSKTHDDLNAKAGCPRCGRTI